MASRIANILIRKKRKGGKNENEDVLVVEVTSVALYYPACSGMARGIALT